MDKQEKKALRKELGQKEMARRVNELTRYQGSNELVTFHPDEMSVPEMASYVVFANTLRDSRNGVHFSGGNLRVTKNYTEMEDTVLDNEYRKRKYGY